MPVASSGVFIGFINQPLQIVLSIAHYRGRCTQSRTNKLIVDDQATKIKTGNKTFYYYTATIGLSRFKRFLCLYSIRNICSIAFAMIAVNGFDHQWVSKFINGFFKPGFSSDNGTSGYRYFSSFQKHFSFFLVAGNVHRNIGCSRCNGGSDSFLIDTISQLYQTLFVETYVWYATLCCFFHNATCRRPQPGVFSYFTKLLNVVGKVIFHTINQRLCNGY